MEAKDVQMITNGSQSHITNTNKASNSSKQQFVQGLNKDAKKSNSSRPNAHVSRNRRSGLSPNASAQNNNMNDVSPNNGLKRVLYESDELKLHLYGTELICEAGLMLQIPQRTICLAQSIYHRFFYQKERNLVDYPPFHVAMTSTYLACKGDEKKRRHRDILTVFDRLLKKRIANNDETMIGNSNDKKAPKRDFKVLDFYTHRYKNWKEILMTMELRILAELSYNLQHNINLSHKYLLTYLNELSCDDKILCQKSWSYLNDLYRIPYSLNYDATLLSGACILLSSRVLQIKLPDNPSWCHVFGLNKNDLIPIATMLLELYQLPKSAFYSLPKGMHECDTKLLDQLPNSIKDLRTAYQDSAQYHNDSRSSANHNNSKSKPQIKISSAACNSTSNTNS